MRAAALVAAEGARHHGLVKMKQGGLSRARRPSRRSHVVSCREGESELSLAQMRARACCGACRRWGNAADKGGLLDTPRMALVARRTKGWRLTRRSSRRDGRTCGGRRLAEPRALTAPLSPNSGAQRLEAAREQARGANLSSRKDALDAAHLGGEQRPRGGRAAAARGRGEQGGEGILRQDGARQGTGEGPHVYRRAARRLGGG